MSVEDLGIYEAPTTANTTFFERADVKRVLLCFHGFQTSRQHDITAFKDYFDRRNRNRDFEVALVNLYDFGDKKTYKRKLMMHRAEEVCASYIKKGYIVYILAYSFSVGIAARLCVEFPSIQKLALISPTTYIIKTKLLSGYLTMLKRSVKLRKRIRSSSSIRLKISSPGFVKLALSIASAIVRYRKYLKKIRCKVLMIKGNKDELSISNTFSYISQKSEDAITMSKIYPDENHVMFMSLQHGKHAFDDVLMFIFHIATDESSDEIIY